MIEMMGVLAIIGVLSVGGIAGYSQAMSKFKISKTIDQAQMLITNIRTLYSSSRKYTGISPLQAYNMGLLTDESFNPTNNTGLNPFGGQIQFGIAEAGRAFTISYTGLTNESCVRLATADWGADQSSGLRSIEISGEGGTSFIKHIWPSEGGTESTALPVELPHAITQCGTSNSGTIRWTYR